MAFESPFAAPTGCAPARIGPIQDGAPLETACSAAGVVRVAWRDWRLHAGVCSAASAKRGARSSPLARTSAPRRHATAAGGASSSASRSGAPRAAGGQPQSRRTECRTGSRQRVCSDPSRRIAARRSSQRRVQPQDLGLGRRAGRRDSDGSCARAPRKRAGSTLGRSGAWPHIPGKLLADQAQRSCIRWSRVGDGSCAGEHSIARRRRTGAGHV